MSCAPPGIASAPTPLTDLEPDLGRSYRAWAGPLVERLAERIAADWLS